MKLPPKRQQKTGDKPPAVSPFLIVPYYSPPDYTEDLGQRPLPSNLDVAIWECPNIEVIRSDETIGPPVAGLQNRVRVRVANRGNMSALLTNVSVMVADFGISEAPCWMPLGSSILQMAPNSQQWVELSQPWVPPASGHACLLAKVDCPLDPAPTAIVDLNDRHYSQRNVTVVEVHSAVTVLATGPRVWLNESSGRQEFRGITLEIPTVTEKLRRHVNALLHGTEFSTHKIRKGSRKKCVLTEAALNPPKDRQDSKHLEQNIFSIRIEGFEKPQHETVELYRFVPKGINPRIMQGFTVLVVQSG
jgi:hypothetical protein